MKAVPRAQLLCDQRDDGAHAVDVQAGVDLVEQGQARPQQRQLQQLVALALAAREAVVDGPAQQGLRQPRRARRTARTGQEVEGIQRRLAARLAHRVQCRADEQVVLHAGDLGRRLEGQEEPGLRALLGRHRQQVLAGKARLAAAHAVARVPGQRQAQRALAAAVGAHQHQQRAGGTSSVTDAARCVRRRRHAGRAG
jgi:hypothetical protein